MTSSGITFKEEDIIIRHSGANITKEATQSKSPGKDFGPGFYSTRSYSHAEDLCKTEFLTYHGSLAVIKSPTIIKTSDGREYGKGLYTTQTPAQASKSGKTKFRQVYNLFLKEQKLPRNSNGNGEVYISNFIVHNFNNLNCHQFDVPTKDWLHCMIANREPCNPKYAFELAKWNQYDILSGPCPDESIRLKLSLYATGFYGEPFSHSADTQFLQGITFSNLSDQICFKTERSLSKEHIEYTSYNIVEVVYTDEKAN